MIWKYSQILEHFQNKAMSYTASQIWSMQCENIQSKGNIKFQGNIPINFSFENRVRIKIQNKKQQSAIWKARCVLITPVNALTHNSFAACLNRFSFALKWTVQTVLQSNFFSLSNKTYLFTSRKYWILLVSFEFCISLSND